MARGYEPEEFIGTRVVPEDRKRNAQQPSRNGKSRDPVREERAQEAGSYTDPGLARSPEPRQVYEVRGRTYRCGPRKSQRWSKSASFARLLRRT